MRKFIFGFALLFVSTLVIGQNAFLNRAFWNENTSIEAIKIAIEKGNDPTEMNFSGFDATTFAVLANAPVSVVEFLLDIKGNDINKVTHDSRNYLMWAGMKGNFEMIAMIIKRGGNVNVIDSKGNNLQTYTAGGGVTNPEVYELYKKYGLRLDQTNRVGGTILHSLAQNVNSLDEMDYFIKEGLDLKAKDKKGNTLIHYAASQGNIQLIKELVSKGLDIKAKNESGETALFFAARGKRGHQNKKVVFEDLEKLGLDIQAVNTDGQNLLHFVAAMNHNHDVFDFLIANKVDVNKVDNAGNLPLMNAVARNNNTGFSALYAATKNKFQVNKEGHSLFTFALRSKNSGVTAKIEADLELKINYNLIDNQGNNLITHLVETYDSKQYDFFNNYFSLLLSKNVNPQNHSLHVAVLKGDTRLIESLLNTKIDINAKNSEDLTPLQLAAMKSHDLTVLKLLIAKGADKSIQTDFDETAYDLAKENELLKGDIEFLK